MMNLYSDIRKNQILNTLSAQPLLNRTHFRKQEQLEVSKAFADALLETVHEKEHASHLSIRSLGNYLLEQAKTFGMDDDKNIKYVAGQLDRLSWKIHCLESGKVGETRANRAMFGIDSPNRILRNVEFTIDGEPFEMDFVIINQAGVFAVEAKRFNRDMVIDQTGTLTDACPVGKAFTKKVCMQMANQRAAVRRVLTEAFVDNNRIIAAAENIRSILLNTSDHSIVDLRGKETILDCDTIVDYLNGASSAGLTRDEINAMADALEKASHARAYSDGWDYGRVAEAFAISIAKIEYASECATKTSCEDEQIDYENIAFEILESEHNSARKSNKAWKMLGSAAAAAAVLAGATWQVAKCLIKTKIS